MSGEEQLGAAPESRREGPEAGDGSRGGASRSAGSDGSGGSRSGGRRGGERRRAEEAAARAHVGAVLGERWEVGGRIGSGGMASVHRGLDRRLERPVAVKILHPHVADSPEARERLAREARAIAQLRHENVIEVYDYDISDPELTWLVTELVEGTTLRRFLERTGPILPELAAVIALELARALRAAHERGIIHRDVKPDNVLVGHAGRPKLSDFGIAKVMAEAGMTATGNLVGSPSYMSPEQADGRPVDARTDLFSLGVVLYRLVTGVLPFRGATPLETVRKVAVAEYPDPLEVMPGCAGSVARVIRRCLARELDARYASAAALIDDLSRIADESGLGSSAEVLPAFFADPAEYTAALRPQLAVRLEARGRSLLAAGEETRGLDCLARAVALSEGEQQTTDLVRQLRLHRGRRSRRTLAAALSASALILLAGGAWWTFAEVPAPVAEAASGKAASEPAARTEDEEGAPEASGGAAAEAASSAEGSGHEDGSGDLRDDHEGRQDGSSTRPDSLATRQEGPAARPAGSGGQREDSEARPEGTGGQREGSEARREGPATRREDSAARQEGSSARREGSATRREGSATRREGSATRREDPEARRGGSAARREGSAARREDSSAHPDGAPARRDDSPARRSPASDEAPARRRAAAPRADPPEVRSALPAPGVLHIGTGMWADIHVDGERRGRAPNQARYELAPGLHVLEAKKPGARCAPFRREIRIRSGETTRVRVALECER